MNRGLINMLFLFILSIVIGVILFCTYFYVAIWLIPNFENRRQSLSWLAMLLATFSFLLIFIAWMLQEPSVREFLPAFVVISIILGLAFRESAISPFELVKFWSKLRNREKN
jgi:hypothetical protein